MRKDGRAAAATRRGPAAALPWPAPCGVAETLIRSIRAIAPLQPDVTLQGVLRRQGQLALGGLRSAEPGLGEPGGRRRSGARPGARGSGAGVPAARAARARTRSYVTAGSSARGVESATGGRHAGLQRFHSGVRVPPHW